MIFTKFPTLDDVDNFRDLRASRPLPAILRAHNNIIAGIHPAEAQVCANRDALHKNAVLLVSIFYLVSLCSVCFLQKGQYLEMVSLSGSLRLFL